MIESADLVSEWYGARDDASKAMQFHTRTAGQSLTAQQPLAEGYFHQEIQDAAYEYQTRFDDEEVVVGVNADETDEGPDPDILTVDERVQERQRSRLETVRIA